MCVHTVQAANSAQRPLSCSHCVRVASSYYTQVKSSLLHTGQIIHTRKGLWCRAITCTRRTFDLLQHWLDPAKKIRKQVKSKFKDDAYNKTSVYAVGPPYTFRFRVKFYSSEPNNLREEITRYQLFLQLKKDILSGQLPAPHETCVDLAALSIQCERLEY